ncbi:MAG TPA: RNA methyltransferase [Planctomycetota bacterium]|jgi:TrmH family RNA methyltransferase|nr:RNA methyltransferase [Planctomycetota bacterium]
MPRPGERITSVRNPLVLRFRRALEGRDRGDVVLEGVRLVEDALASGVVPAAVLVSPRLAATEGGRRLLERLTGSTPPPFPATDAVVAAATEARTHQGVAAIAPVPAWGEEDLFPTGGDPFLLVAAGVQDPGNLGALLRVAEAAGATGFLATDGSARPFQDRCARASAGALFRVPVLAGLAAVDAAALLARRGLRLLAADSRGGEDFRRADLAGPIALLLGSEGHGLPPALRRAADLRVRIPLRGRVESLNVAAAAAVLAFEVARRREERGVEIPR